MKKIAIVGSILLVVGLGYFLTKPNLGATLPVAGQTYTLAGSGTTGSATSITLSSLTIPQTGYELQDSDFSDTFYITFEPGNRQRQEIASCTTVVQNVNGTATLSGCTRGLLPFTPFTASSSYQFAHGGGTSVIFSDPPQLFNEFTAKSNNETITGLYTFTQLPLSSTSTPTDQRQLITLYQFQQATTTGGINGSETAKGVFEGATQAEMALGTEFGATGASLALLSKYATSTRTGTGNFVIVTAGTGYVSSTFGGVAFSMATLNSNALVVENPASATSTPTANSIPLTSASTTELNRWVNAFERIYTAGEDIVATSSPVPVYLSSVDGKVYKTSSNFTSSTFRFVGFVGKSQSSTADTDVYVTEGEGAFVPGFTGLTVGTEYYLSTTGTIATSGGTVPWKIARAVSTTILKIEKAPKKYVGTYSNNVQSATASSITTTINVGFKAKKISIVGTAGLRDDSTIISRSRLPLTSDGGVEIVPANNPFWYEGTTYGLQQGATSIGDDSTYLLNKSATSVYSRLSILSTTQSAVTFLWEYQTTSNGNTNDQAWINYAYIIEE